MIYVLAPDWDYPAGGVRRLYHWVDTLNDLDLRATIVHHAGDFRCSWFDNTTRIVAAPDVHLYKGDLVVISDWIARRIPRSSRPAPGIPKVLLNLDLFIDKQILLEDPEYIALLGVSEYAANLAARAFPSVDIHRVRHGLDSSIFYDGHRARSRVLSYMPRKTDKADYLLAMVEASGALRGWSVQALAGLAERDVGDALRQTSIFLSFSESEGFGRPPLEAMACGCVVAGYAGQGGREYFLESHSFPVADGDLLEFANTLERVLRLFEDDREYFNALGASAADFAREHYSVSQERSDLNSAFGALLQHAAEWAPAGTPVSLGIGPQAFTSKTSHTRKALYHAREAGKSFVARRR